MLPNRNLFGSALGLALTFVVVGCSGGEKSDTTTSPDSAAKTTAGATPAKAGKQLKLAFVTNNSSQYWTIAHKGVEKAEAELPNVKVDFEMPPGGTAAEQKSIVDDLLVKGVDGIAISPKDPKNQTDLINEWASKTLVITQDSDAATSKRTCYIGTDNEQAGELVGKELLKALPNGGKVVAFVGDADAQNAHDRIEGVKKALVGSKVQLVDVRTDAADHLKAKSNAADVLVAMPDVAGLVGIWSYNGPAISAAVTDAGKAGKVKIVCFDDEDGTIEGLEKGTIQATVVQQPFEFGYQAIKKMSAYLNGDKSVFPANGLDIIPAKVVTPADVVAYAADLKKLTGK